MFEDQPSRSKLIPQKSVKGVANVITNHCMIETWNQTGR